LSKLVELPKGWVETKFEELTELRKIGLDRSRREQFDSGIPYLKMNNITLNGKLDLNSLVYVNCSKEELNNFLLKKGDILFNTRNSYELVGKTTIWNNSIQNCIFNNNIMRIRTNDLVLPQMLFYFMNSIIFRNSLLSVKKATTNICAIYDKDLKNQKIVLPPLNEQKRIVSKIEELFSELDHIKDTLQKVKLQLVQYRQSLLKSAFEGKLTTKYEIKKLGDAEISEIIMGQSPPSSTYNKEKQGMPFFQGKKDFGKKYPTTTVWCTKPTRIAKKGDILLSVRAPVGTTNWATEKCCIGRGLSAIRVKILPEYVYYFLKSIEIKLSRTGGGSIFNAITKNQLYDLSIYSPPLEKQQKIVSQLEQSFSLIDNTESITNSMLKQLDTLQSSILKQAFEGKLVPQDPNDEPAEKLLQRIKEQKQTLQIKTKSRGKK
jgi:type I restriction enzyme, S subunit